MFEFQCPKNLGWGACLNKSNICKSQIWMGLGVRIGQKGSSVGISHPSQMFHGKIPEFRKKFKFGNKVMNWYKVRPIESVPVYDLAS